MEQVIHQGHRYTIDGYSVLAMESATRGLVKVRRITTTVPVIGMERSFFVDTEELKPAPMRYHGGKIPGEANLNSTKEESVNSVKITYIVCDAILALSLLAFAALAPIFITPGYYWWTAFAIILMISQSHAFTNRLNSWGGMGNASKCDALSKSPPP